MTMTDPITPQELAARLYSLIAHNTELCADPADPAAQELGALLARVEALPPGGAPAAPVDPAAPAPVAAFTAPITALTYLTQDGVTHAVGLLDTANPDSALPALQASVAARPGVIGVSACNGVLHLPVMDPATAPPLEVLDATEADTETEVPTDAG